MIKNFNTFCILLCVRRSIISFKMNLAVYVQLMFLCVVNIVFIFSGIILNTLVIVSIWKSSQLRKKLCHFMIMVLSCVDLIAVVTNYPGLLLLLIIWLREDYDLLPTWTRYLDFVRAFLGFSFCALLVMSIERYLGAYYPIFHRTSVTRRRLLTLLAILLIIYTVLDLIYLYNTIMPRVLGVTIFVFIVFLPLVYLNFKLFKISKEVSQRKAASPEKRTTLSLKSISTCLLVVACLLVLSISTIVSIVFQLNAENQRATNAMLSHIWATTIYAMNCTLNSLIFFWRNKVLRTEGIKILKTLKYLLVEA